MGKKQESNDERDDRAAIREERAEADRRQIVPRVDDPELFEFLESLFEVSENDAKPGEPKSGVDTFPSRLALRSVHGAGGRDLGPLVWSVDFKASSAPLPSRERLVVIANEIVSKAQHEAGVLGRRARFAVLAHSAVKGAQAYARHLLVIGPGPRELSEAEVATDEEEIGGAIAMPLLRELARDRRYFVEAHAQMFERYSSSMDALISRYEQRLAASEHANGELLKVHIELAKTKEELLDRKQARELKQRKEQFVQEQIEEGVKIVKSLLPAVSAYLTRGKAGVNEGVRRFFHGLDDSQKEALFGQWGDGGRLSAGVLDEEQVATFIGIVDGKIGPEAIGGFIASLTPDQMASAQAILQPQQLVALMGIADAVRKATGANGVLS